MPSNGLLAAVFYCTVMSLLYPRVKRPGLPIMKVLVRLIFRFDFEVNFQIINAPGTVLKILKDECGDYWTQLAESRNERRVVGSHTDGLVGEHREMIVEPVSVSGSFESADGFEWEGEKVRIYIRNCSRVMEQLGKEFDVRLLKRVGMRFFVLCLNKSENPKEAYFRLISPKFRKRFEEEFGEVEDLGTVLEGNTPDGVKFRLKTGPSMASDPGKFVTNVAVKSRIGDLQIGDLSGDVDLYENDLDFAGMTLLRWSRTKWPIAEQMLDVVAKEMKS